MSVLVKEEDPQEGNSRAFLLFDVAKAIATIFYVLSASLFAITLLVLFLVLVTNVETDDKTLSIFVFAQRVFCDFAVAFISYHVYHIVDSCKNKEGFFSNKQTKRLRCIASMLMVVFLVQVALWLYFAQFGLESLPLPVTDSWYLFGFPSGTVWDAALTHAAKPPKVEATADINFGIAIMALVIWCLSYAFERGLTLQRESDQTV